MDAARIKQLLSSTDIVELRTAISDFSRAENDLMESSDNNSNTQQQRQQEQLCKLQIMLWSRVLTLQQQQQQQGTGDSKSINNGLVETYQSIGQLWMRGMGDSAKAVGQFNKGLAINSRHVTTLQLLSHALVNLSEYEKAIQHQEMAIRILEEQEDAPIDGGGSGGGSEFRQDILVMAYTQLANIYECKGEFQQAVALLKANLERIQIINRISTVQVHEDVLMDVYSRLGVIQTKLGGHNQEAAMNLRHAYTWHVKTRGEDDAKTQEMAFLLDLALTS